MQASTRIHAFFVVAALLFWNPASFYLLYRNTSTYGHGLVHAGFWLVAGLGILAVVLIRKNKCTPRAADLLLCVSFLGLSFAFVVILNAALGLFDGPDKVRAANGIPENGLIFEPNASARYASAEFDYTARINSIGLRDREIALDKGDKYRVLCFGDSWTFGWGVELEHSWPKQLEQYLHEQGLNHIEVVNAGQGNQYSATYREYIERVVPVLKPDLVLVGVLQLDDLAQLYENKLEREEAVGKAPLTYLAKRSILDFVKSSLGNFIALLKDSRNKPLDVGANWKESVTRKIAGFSELEMLRFQALDDSVQALFRSGDLNAGLLGRYINFPERVALFNDPENPATKYGAAEMRKDFAAMKRVCDKNGAQLVFVNMPSNYFTGHKVIRTALDKLNPFFEEHNHVDSIYSAVARANGLPYIELTGRFRALEPKDAYFFLYDGHPNKEGYREVAAYIGDQLIRRGIVQTR